MEVVHGIRPGRPDLRHLRGVVGLVQAGEDLVRHRSLEQPPETRQGVASGLVVWRQDEYPPVAEDVGQRARALVQVVVLPGDDEVVAVALAPGEIGGCGVAGHVDATRVQNVGHHRAEHVREDDAGEQADAVVADEAFGDLFAHRRAKRVVLDHKLDRHAAEPSIVHLERELQRVPRIGAEIAAGAGERGDHADAQRRTLREGRGGERCCRECSARGQHAAAGDGCSHRCTSVRRPDPAAVVNEKAIR